MTKALAFIWGLLFDDLRLAGVLVLFLVAAGLLVVLHAPLAAAVVIWAGLIVSLFASIRYQLKLKGKK